MKKRYSFAKKATPHPIGIVLSVILVCALSAFTTLFALWMHPVSLMAMLLGMLKQPLLILLNGLPILLLIAAFALLFGNVFYSAALINLFVSGGSIVNRVKIQVRDDPFVPRDITLVKEAMDAAGNYDMSLPWSLIIGLIGITVLLIVLGRLFPSRQPKGKKWATRGGGFAACVTVLVCIVSFVYSSTGIYSSFSVSNSYNLSTACNELGFPYFFCYHFSTYKVAEPDGFDRQAAAAWDAEQGTASHAADVNVIFIMNEAFSDITNNDVFTYSDEDDPIRTFNKLAAGENTVSGHIIVPYFAGGTADTEFDVATGMQTAAINPASPSLTAFRTLTRQTESIFSVMSDDGYYTSYLHPGHAWFYNRQNVFRLLGADDSMFVDDFTGLEYKGSWVTDSSVSKNIKDSFVDASSSGTPMFTYAVTIQNHMSYTEAKYGDDYTLEAVETNALLSAEMKTALSVYIEGLRDADAMLEELTEYFSNTNEPVMLVFFGDHLPYLGDNRQAYRELGLAAAGSNADSDPIESYEAPYLIWCNAAAAEALDFDEAVSALDLPKDGRISASFLGAVTLELLGREGESPWFDFLNSLRRELPVVHANIPDDLSELVSKYRSWSYYKLKYGLG